MNFTSVNFSARNPLGVRTAEEMRAKLNQAADDAKLNVTERMALNDEYFPQGGGFELFPESAAVHRINTFRNPVAVAAAEEEDGFTIQVRELEIPENVSKIQKRTYNSSKGNFQANLDNALKKLKSVLNPKVKK